MIACKRQKLNSETANWIKTETERSITSLCLIDLCADCLSMIFDYLSIGDIVNLVEANITGSLTEKNKNKSILKIDQFNECSLKAFMSKSDNDVVQTIAKFAPNGILMLRHFGRHFDSLRIVYGDENVWALHDSRGNRRYEKGLEDAIMFNCRETLTAICFERCDQYAMNEIEESFPNVELVTFRDGDLSRKLRDLNNCFPRMQFLRFYSLNISDSNSKCLHQHFPLLKSFKVYDTLNFTDFDLKIFLTLNPQLKYLAIINLDGANEIVVTHDLISLISKSLINLESLKLTIDDFRFNAEIEPVINFANLVYLKVESEEFHDLDKVKLTSPKLNKLTLVGDPQQTYYEVIKKFVTYAKPKQLEIRYAGHIFDIGNEHFNGITRTLPMLREVCVKSLWYDEVPDVFINFLVDNEAITKLIGVFTFYFDENVDSYPKYCRMRQMFKNKIVENDFVAKKWTLAFRTTDDEFCFYVDTVHFNKNK